MSVGVSERHATSILPFWTSSFRLLASAYVDSVIVLVFGLL